MNCAIISAGQLGSRHLQGLLQYNFTKLEIYVVDPSEESLNLTKTRALEINHFHNLYFIKSIENLPSEIEFVIVATSSKVRLSVIKQLLSHSKVRFLILEKVLFPKLSDYSEAIKLIEENNVKCWVNHPRRMFDSYSSLKKYFDNTNGISSFQLLGASWGLACNALHFIDLFEYLTDSSLQSISVQNLDKQPISSKREGYVEFEGTIQGVLNGGHLFSISSLAFENPVSTSISIMNVNSRAYIQEVENPHILLFERENSFNEKKLPFDIKYQSQLTGVLFQELIETGNCNLPTFSHSSKTHSIFIEALLKHWNINSGMNREELPIT